MRRILLISFVVFFAFSSWAYAAKKFPSRNITNVVVWGAGGGTDTCNRIISAEMAKVLGVNINVINNQTVRTLGLPVGDYQSMDIYDNQIYIMDKVDNSILVLESRNGNWVNRIPIPSILNIGVCFDEENIWVIDPASSRLLFFNFSGEEKGNFRAPESHPCALAYFNKFIWCVDKSGKLFKLKF